MCIFEMPLNRKNNLKGETNVRILNMSCTKKGFTVALSLEASDHKLSAFCILKEPLGKISAKVISKKLYLEVCMRR